MNIHEYQAKELLKRYGVPVPLGKVASTAQEVKATAAELGFRCVVKAQIHAGGRGKAGGVKPGRDGAAARAGAPELPRQKPVPPHTRPAGRVGAPLPRRSRVGHRGRSELPEWGRRPTRPG